MQAAISRMLTGRVSWLSVTISDISISCWSIPLSHSTSLASLVGLKWTPWHLWLFTATVWLTKALKHDLLVQKKKIKWKAIEETAFVFQALSAEYCHLVFGSEEKDNEINVRSLTAVVSFLSHNSQCIHTGQTIHIGFNIWAFQGLLSISYSSHKCARVREVWVIFTKYIRSSLKSSSS